MQTLWITLTLIWTGTATTAAPDGGLANDKAEMVAAAKSWAEQACGGPWVISDILAVDFQGTFPKGERYSKPATAPTFGPETVWSTDCRLDEAEVRFFGKDVAVMYGAESKTVPLADGKQERRCLKWTDTWVRREGRWQIVAAHDTRVECPRP